MKHYLAILLVLACLTAAPVRPAAAQYTTTEVKAAFLVNFAKFTTWPKDSSPTDGSELRIGIMGRNPFGPALKPFQGKSVQGHPVRILPVSTLEEATSCHILFISAAEQAHLVQILGNLEAKGILTVSDIPGFAARGGMIELQEVDQRIRFTINLDASRRSGLKLSSHLLKLASKLISTREKLP